MGSNSDKIKPHHIFEGVSLFYLDYALFLLERNNVDDEELYERGTHEYRILKAVDGLRLMARNNSKVARYLENLGDNGILPLRATTDNSPVRTANEGSRDNDVSVRRVMAAEAIVSSQGNQSAGTLPDTQRVAPPEEQVWFRYQAVGGKTDGNWTYYHRIRDILITRNGINVEYRFVCPNSKWFLRKANTFWAERDIEFAPQPTDAKLCCATCFRARPTRKMPLTIADIKKLGLYFGIYVQPSLG